MPDTDANSNASDRDERPAADGIAEQGNPELNPLDGGRWRPVSPDELLRKNVSDEGGDANPTDGQPTRTVQLERRQELEHKLKANPTDLEGFLELAAIYREEQRPLEAKRLLKQAAAIFPDDENVCFQLEEAILARSLQQYREVSELAARLKTPEADHELGRSRSDWAMRRIEVCHARLQRNPSQVSLRFAMAEAKFDADLFDEAFDDAGDLLELDAFAPQAHFLRARCLLALGKDLPAMKELRAVALRRAVVAPERLRHASLKLLCELSDKLSLESTGQQYREHLRRLAAATAKKPPEEQS
jgi:tetratricopeptide (TPR) repeat protein